MSMQQSIWHVHKPNWDMTYVLQAAAVISTHCYTRIMSQR